MVFVQYLVWHYTKALEDIVTLTGNFLLWGWHKFAIAIHAKTLFAAWKRQELPKEDTDSIFTRMFNVVIDAIINFYLRILAAVIRLSIIILGLMAELFISLSFIFLFLFWILWPAILIFWVVKGGTLIFS